MSSKNIYQVISAHPHDLEEMREHMKTIYKNGRLWVVQLKAGAPPKVLKHLRSLSGGERSYVQSQKSFLKETPLFKSYTDEMRTNNIRSDVYLLSEYKSRAAASAGNKQAIKDLKLRFEEMKYDVEEICYEKNSCSIIAEKKGSSKTKKVVMTMAHVDSVGKDYAGADDNGSGVAVILEMARVLKDYKNSKTIRFFISNGEERGLLGATHYARYLESSKLISELDLVINMDMVGYNSNGIVELETDPNQKNLAEWFAMLAGEYTGLKTKITLGAWGSDHVPFLKRGVPAILTIENWDTKTPCYHQACDTPETLNYDYATKIGKLNLAAVLHKDIE